MSHADEVPEKMSEQELREPTLKDLCMNCGKRHLWRLWGAACSCPKPQVVHLRKCNGCEQVMGQRTDDDYCCPELLFCPACVTAALKRGEEGATP